MVSAGRRVSYGWCERQTRRPSSAITCVSTTYRNNFVSVGTEGDCDRRWGRGADRHRYDRSSIRAPGTAGAGTRGRAFISSLIGGPGPRAGITLSAGRNLSRPRGSSARRVGRFLINPISARQAWLPSELVGAAALATLRSVRQPVARSRATHRDGNGRLRQRVICRLRDLLGRSCRGVKRRQGRGRTERDSSGAGGQGPSEAFRIFRNGRAHFEAALACGRLALSLRAELHQSAAQSPGSRREQGPLARAEVNVPGAGWAGLAGCASFGHRSIDNATYALITPHLACRWRAQCGRFFGWSRLSLVMLSASVLCVSTH